MISRAVTSDLGEANHLANIFNPIRVSGPMPGSYFSITAPSDLWGHDARYCWSHITCNRNNGIQ